MSAFDVCEAADLISDEARSVLANVEAEERLLACMDVYSDWEYGHCLGVDWRHCRISYVPRDELALERFVASLDVPQLKALQLHPRTDARVMACEALKAKFIASQGDYIAKLAAEVVVE